MRDLAIIGVVVLCAVLGMGCECPRCSRDLGMFPRRCPCEGQVPK